MFMTVDGYVGFSYYSHFYLHFYLLINCGDLIFHCSLV
jgi:hypothetical protein